MSSKKKVDAIKPVTIAELNNECNALQYKKNCSMCGIPLVPSVVS